MICIRPLLEILYYLLLIIICEIIASKWSQQYQAKKNPSLTLKHTIYPPTKQAAVWANYRLSVAAENLSPHPPILFPPCQVCSGLLCPAVHPPASTRLWSSVMETRLATRAKVTIHNELYCSVLLSLVFAGVSAFALRLFSCGLTVFVFLLPLPCCQGVTKAVNHINDTLGPALIKSVSSSGRI